jgi:hypothetical protein
MSRKLTVKMAEKQWKREVLTPWDVHTFFTKGWFNLSKGRTYWLAMFVHDFRGELKC